MIGDYVIYTLQLLEGGTRDYVGRIEDIYRNKQGKILDLTVRVDPGLTVNSSIKSFRYLGKRAPK